ncbi:DUF4369 domain-containing protein [Ulvibacter antarcticus]|uniref:Uncharacterized protein DUF4369 n=1 Tax=Ulvibacter antarcticus TaxID=442714 RepID=A0A3L9YCQ7_9FLAO|nr:DUF4369 domain-containing protein [Ulvibacter antarcticus]RMA58466.1 uncharacterized protein DUF4369 [Ulvibacter antarcticus]
MKYVFSLFAVLVLVVSCSKSDKEMQLSGYVKGLKKGTILLQKIEDTLLVSVDSVQINGDSNFKFSEEIESPEVYYLYLRLKDGTLLDDRIPFFAEAGEITINTSLKSFAIDAVITGSNNEKLFDDYKKIKQRYTTKNLEYIEEKFAAYQEGNDSLFKSLEKKSKNLESSKYLMTVNYALNNFESELSPYLVLSEIPNANIKYLDTVYQKLTPKIKDSKYGKALESFIGDRKKSEN